MGTKKRKIRKTGKSLFSKTYRKEDKFNMIKDISEVIAAIHEKVPNDKVSITVTHLIEENKSLENDKSLKTIK